MLGGWSDFQHIGRVGMVMKTALFAIGLTLMAAASAPAQAAQGPQAANPAMADAETPNGRVVVDFFKLVSEKKFEEAFDKYWGGDPATKTQYIAAMHKMVQDNPRAVTEQPVAVIARDDYVLLEVVSVGSGTPALVRRLEHLQNGKIISHQVPGNLTPAQMQEIGTKLGAK